MSSKRKCSRVWLRRLLPRPLLPSWRSVASHDHPSGSLGFYPVEFTPFIGACPASGCAWTQIAPLCRNNSDKARQESCTLSLERSVNVGRGSWSFLRAGVVVRLTLDPTRMTY